MGIEKAEDIGRMRVVKKLAPSSRGAIRLARQFGEMLLCVRHRVDARAKNRFTTVELLVGQAAIQEKPVRYVAVRITWEEHELREIVKAAGGTWDGVNKVWRLPRRLASILRLTNRIVSE